jgi:prevent-host-death family protein
MVKEALRRNGDFRIGMLPRELAPDWRRTIMVMIVISGALHMSTAAKQSWTVASAKARFSELIEKAKSDGPQTLTRNGRPTAVLVSIEEWERKTARKGTLSEFFQNSPLRDSGIDLVRLDHPPRKIDL